MKQTAGERAAGAPRHLQICFTGPGLARIPLARTQTWVQLALFTRKLVQRPS
ncbi:hypothetical protein ACFW1F_07615 [Streptomyces bungoensis]|uniref:hypothetical protein n=1 Tax=Streptomyces bungoensis TaxID=285568 RepID=UPI0036CD2364